MMQTKTHSEIVIGKEYAIELTRTGRGWFAEVKDAGSPFNGAYALGSIPAHAIAALEQKIKDLQR